MADSEYDRSVLDQMHPTPGRDAFTYEGSTELVDRLRETLDRHEDWQ